MKYAVCVSPHKNQMPLRLGSDPKYSVPFFSKSAYPFMIPLYSFIYGVVEEIKEECWFDLEKFDGEDLFKN